MSEPKSFISMWADGFTKSATNPTVADGIGVALGLLSGGISLLAKAGLAGKAAEEAERTADLLIGGQGTRGYEPQ